MEMYRANLQTAGIIFGVIASISATLNPVRAENTPVSQNLLVNADFSEGPAAGSPNTVPAKWAFWQAENSGTCTWDGTAGNKSKGAVRVTGVKYASVYQAVAVKPTEQYSVKGVCRQSGAGNPWILIRWKTADGKWINDAKVDVTITPDTTTTTAGAVDQGTWQTLSGTLSVPENAANLVFMVVSGKSNTKSAVPEDIVWFDDLQLTKLP
jgi:hypothetical protein